MLNLTEHMTLPGKMARASGLVLLQVNYQEQDWGQGSKGLGWDRAVWQAVHSKAGRQQQF